jgi:hypothetical protein
MGIASSMFQYKIWQEGRLSSVVAGLRPVNSKAKTDHNEKCRPKTLRHPAGNTAINP